MRWRGSTSAWWRGLDGLHSGVRSQRRQRRALCRIWTIGECPLRLLDLCNLRWATLAISLARLESRRRLLLWRKKTNPDPAGGGGGGRLARSNRPLPESTPLVWDRSSADNPLDHRLQVAIPSTGELRLGNRVAMPASLCVVALLVSSRHPLHRRAHTHTR